MNIILANPRGFCAGVDRAIAIVERALDLFGAPVYLNHEPVHNKAVVADLLAKGAIIEEDLDKIPENAILVFSAHGVSVECVAHAKKNKLKVFNATCPLVTKVHMEVAHAAKTGDECVLIGHKGHPEVIGTMGQYDNPAGGIYLVEDVAQVEALTVKDPTQLKYFTQTTLSVDDTQIVIEALKRKFPAIAGPRREDICYATQNRQEAVKALANKADVVLVVGSKNSSNSNRLAELARDKGCAAYLIDGPDDLQRDWFSDSDNIGLTAGASAPEMLVQAVITQLKAWGATSVNNLSGVEENITFALPKELRTA